MTERPILFSGPMVRAILAGAKTQTRRIADGLRVIPRRKVTADPMPGQHLGDLVAVAPPHRYRAGIGRAGAVFADLGDEGNLGLKPGEFDFVCPYADGRTYLDDGQWRVDVAVDQRLWVRETWSKDALGVYPCPPIWYRADFTDYDDPARGEHGHGCKYERTGKRESECFACALDGGRFRWRPSIHMPRRASRLTLEITGLRVQRLQEITEDDARAEGINTSVVDPSPTGLGALRMKHYAHARDAFADLWDSINGDRATWASNPWVWALTFRRLP